MEIALFFLIFPMFKLLLSKFEQDNLRGLVVLMLYFGIAILKMNEITGGSDLIIRFYPMVIFINLLIIIRIYNLYRLSRSES